jgi:hypothetical protein
MQNYCIGVKPVVANSVHRYGIKKNPAPQMGRDFIFIQDSYFLIPFGKHKTIPLWPLNQKKKKQK